MKYRIGTRGSKLALVQAESVRQRLTEAYPEDIFELQIIHTKGDQIQNKPLNQIGDKGLFVREIEEKLVENEIQMAVHSMKDMPSDPASGLKFTKSWKREDARDVLILRKENSLEALPQGAVIGTGSVRRRLQLLQLRPDLNIVDIRGNVDTRLRKLEEQKLDGIVLAAAGLKRLGMEQVITRYLEFDEMIPAPAQGVLALEIREANEELESKLDALSEEESSMTAAAEREFLRLSGGNCHVPVGAVCTKESDGYILRAVFGTSDERLAYARVHGTDGYQMAKEAVLQIRKKLAGTVYLVGGGPGDPGLITKKGLDCIRKADCLIYDRLSAPELLKEAKKDCECIYVGKENRHHTRKQEEINQLLADKAMTYQNIVRLKGGDVYVFGRGGEEGMFLFEQGIPFEVVPGVTSAIAGLAYAGIPITHRGIAGGFHVVTAHNRRDELAEIDFDAIARSQETCVFLMGLSKAGEIAERLMKAGMDSAAKVAVISHATTREQNTVISTLSNIQADIEQSGITSPALIVIGKVINCRDSLNFFEPGLREPAEAENYLIPRIGEQPLALTKLLQEKGKNVTELTVGKIEYKNIVLEKKMLDKIRILVLTSRNGAEAFLAAMIRSRLDIRSLANTKIAVIGRKTEEVLNRSGLFAELIPEQANSDSLAELIKNNVSKNDEVCYVKAENADNHLEKMLEGDCTWKNLVLYENVKAEFPVPNETELSSYRGIVFTCASSAERLLGGYGAEIVEKINNKTIFYSIGPKCTKALRALGAQNISESAKAEYESLAELVE